MTDTRTSASTVSEKDGVGLAEAIRNRIIELDGERLTDSELREMVAAGLVVTKRTKRPYSMSITTMLTVALVAFCVGAVIQLWEWYGTALVP